MPEGSSNDNVSVPVPTNQVNNPLLHKLTPKQFEASVKFYEADQKLKTEDRESVAGDLQSIMFKTAFIGYGSAIGNFFIPTIVNRYQNPKKTGIPTKVRPTVHKPFLSFIIGLTAMLITNQQVAKYQFSKKIGSLEGDSSKKNQMEVWRAMDYHQASLFFLYFRKTAENPSFIIKDPRGYTEKTQHEVHYNPPSAKSLHFTSALGIGSGNNDSENDSTSHWDQIRVANGFVPDENSEKPGPDHLDGSAGSNKFYVDNNNESEHKKKPTAWDSIRQHTEK